jgi:hypothetical protein
LNRLLAVAGAGARLCVELERHLLRQCWPLRERAQPGIAEHRDRRGVSGA